jgi:DNA-binding response OmpR family regulator
VDFFQSFEERGSHVWEQLGICSCRVKIVRMDGSMLDESLDGAMEAAGLKVNIERSQRLLTPFKGPFSHPTFLSGLRAFQDPTDVRSSQMGTLRGPASPRILIVEQDFREAAEIQAALEEYLQAIVYHTDIENADKSISQTAPDLVLLRLVPVRERTYTFCKRTRSQSDVPIVVYGSLHDDVDELLSLELGADDFISMSRQPRIFGARIHALLRRIARAPGRSMNRPAATLSELSVDRSRFVAQFRDQALDLSVIDFRLLAVLADRAQSIVPYQEIAELLDSWGENSTIKVIHTRMHRINVKLRSASADRLKIKNRRMAGYGIWPTEG